MRSIGEVSEATAIAIARRDFRCPQRAPVIPAHEGHEQALAGGIPHELHGILNRLRPSYVELDPALQTERPQAFSGQLLGYQHFLFMEILAGELRETV